MKEFFKLFQKYSPTQKGAEDVFLHTTITLQIAKQIVSENKLSLNWDIAEKGILLHDIGVFECEKVYGPRVVKPYIQHAFLGAMILRAEGFSEAIIRMVERHIGLGISKKEIEDHNYPLPHLDFIPETLEEKILCYADKFHSKDKGFVTFEKREQQYQKFGKGPLTRLYNFKKEFRIPNLQRIIEKV
ncbi:hypothetical protein A2X44_04280 [candidate division CPR3 bacterium GWF2_35_18]|uniref:Metal dependent phosphohydrolase n=1 Tax=candidate division CPR3 bacterium GW2011_GWF2_35_18 TaxID=1618350 RepID=A0A0G0BZP9_UNCC3|nr:MAG: Metal dependent phosphohydrolase [candidate division CPR3 bacterium GW2011_GWF2_35_18]KKP86954.1 MAG: Metal dependent phosphohydrolase [candidate division CPR3 bacterium GW2011_GWE2_35_7]OGB62572.1 MAG: hypothetical protein A2X44_04280 [candidate division CPR3 bacterium GWF2_35_18]OGB65823.1 MAG: hypothetical protein A2250_01530 [candidate division CPR3 bacterium RIFOXYA2_FULL_35_13]OGB77354.1 MAG: hypothetical protein A2476_04040 [candidate division CPR3 bacterium RIFOXYC2_FULL_35_7]O